MLVDLAVLLVDYITSFHLFGTQVENDRKENQNIAIAYLSIDVDSLPNRSLVSDARIFRLPNLSVISMIAVKTLTRIPPKRVSISLSKAAKRKKFRL
jgi:hypothetical protein